MPQTGEPGKHTEQFMQRVNYAVMLMLDNQLYIHHSKKNTELLDRIMEFTGCSRRQALRYLKVARQEVLKIGFAKRDEAYIKAVRDLELCFETAKGINKISSMIRAVEVRAKLQGLIVDHVSLSTAGVKPDLSKLTNEELKALAELK